MPKIATDYSTREISFYRFVCNDPEIQSSYVGHTVDFNRRKAQHKSVCNNPNARIHHLQIYQTIKEYGGWDNWRMLEIESRLVKDKREAERIEQEYIDNLKANLNTCKAFRGETTQETHRLYRIENADKIKEQNKQYRIENAEKIKEQQKEYHIKNADKIKELKKQYRIENADKIKQYHIENADKIKEQKKQYRIENAEKIKELKKEYRIVNAEKIKEQKRQSYLKKKEQAKLNALPL